MGANSKIQWTRHTFNPWIGCDKVSPGCDHCYAEAGTNARVSRGKGLPLWGERAHRQVTSPGYWRQPRRWNEEARALGQRHRVFCASQADVFEADGDQVLTGHHGCCSALSDIRQWLWQLIEETPHLIWMLLTKRPENIAELVPPRWIEPIPDWPENVWPGFTAEDQAHFDQRWAVAKTLPAPVIFCSLEPQLGPVSLPRDFLDRGQRVWPITGGESDPQHKGEARPYDLGWPRALLAQTRPAGVPLFVKQLGARPGAEPPPGVYTYEAGADFLDRETAEMRLGLRLRHPKGGDIDEWPEDLQVREVPGEQGGR